MGVTLSVRIMAHFEDDLESECECERMVSGDEIKSGRWPFDLSELGFGLVNANAVAGARIIRFRVNISQNQV